MGKKIGIFLLIVVAVPLITALFTKKEYSVEREIIINQDKKTVFNYLKYLKNQQNFSEWSDLDPSMKKDFQGTDGKPGFMYSWDSENDRVGKGSQVITKIIESDRIESILRFQRPIRSTGYAYFNLYAVNNNQTEVTWGFQSKIQYPLNILLLLLDVEEELGNNFDNGLRKLKSNLEK